MFNLGSIFFGLEVDTSKMGKAGNDIAAFGQKVSQTFGKTKQDMDTSVTAGFKAMSQAAALTLGPLNGVVFRLREATSIMGSYGVAVGITAAALSGMAVTTALLGKELADTVINYQKAEMALKGITGSVSIAQAELGFLRDSANQSGQSFTDLAPAFSRFVSSATGAGQALSVTNDEFRKFSMVAGTLHLTTEETNNVMRAFDQMLSMGRVQGQEMRQLFNNFPAVFEIASNAAKDLGVNLRDAMKSGSLESGKFIQAFMTEAVKMFNINLGHPIDTLQASLTRVKTSWQTFLLTLNDAINASSQLQGFFKGLANTINNLSANMDGLLQVIAGVAGALAGLLTVLAINAAFTGLMGLLGPLIAFIGNFIAALALARDATELLTAAQIGLDIAMTANPIGAVIVAVAALGAAVFGATSMMKMFHTAVSANMATMADTSSIDTYIKKQQELGQNIASVTNQMIKQVETMNVANTAQVDQASVAYMAAKKKFDDAQAFNVGRNGSNEVPASRIAELQTDMLAKGQALTNLTESGGKLMVALKNLGGLNTLPEAQTLATGSGSTKPPKDAERGLRTLDGIIQRAQDAGKALTMMWAGPQSSGLLDALEQARKALFDMKPLQLAELTKILNGSGVNVGAMGGLTNALTLVIAKTEMAKEAVKNFNEVWNTLDKGQIKLGEINKQLDYLRGGGDPDKIWIVQASQKAAEALRKLTNGDLPALKATLEGMTNDDGRKTFGAGAISSILGAAQQSSNLGLDAVKKALADIGYTGDTAQSAMTKFYEALDGGEVALQRTTQLMQDLRSGIEGLAASRAQLGAIASGSSLDKVLDVGALYKAMDALKNMAPEDMAAVVTQLDALGISGETAAQKLANFWKTQDRNKEAINDFTVLLNQQEQAWTSFSSNAVDALYGLVTGTQGASDALKSILADLGKTILDAAIVDPLKQGLANGIRGIVQGRTNGSDNSADAASQGLTTLGATANFLSNIFGVNLVGSILQSVGVNVASTSVKSSEAAATIAATGALTIFTGAVLAAAAASGASATASFFETAAAAAVLVNTGGFVQRLAGGGVSGMITGRGGPKGDMIPSMLSNGEFVVNAMSAKKFLPLLFSLNNGIMPHFADGGSTSTSGASTPFVPSNSLLMGNQKGAIIDNRTSIHIAGNVDQGVWDQMKAYLDQRDASFKEQVPYLIDQRVMDSTARGRYS